MPIPPATKTTFWTRSVSIFGGGQTKLPPTLIFKDSPKIFFVSCHCKNSSQYCTLRDRSLRARKLRDAVPCDPYWGMD